MKLIKSKIITLSILVSAIFSIMCSAQNLPVIKKGGAASQLFVNGSPLLMISGELQNSSASTLSYLEPVWDDLNEMNLNSVFVPISWEQFEPEEGKYDFSLLDGIIEKANDHDLKLVILWFGTWKNGYSSYTPIWVKKDDDRFYRLKDENGKNLQRISVFCKEALKSDARAFSVMMERIRKTDKDQTVVAVQINNEVGIKQAIDYSEESLKLLNSDVPSDLINYLENNKETLNNELKTVWALNGYKTSGTWIEIFGDNPSAREFFMAWHYAYYLNEIAREGKSEYNLPMYVNAALVHYRGELPGKYLCGGPVARVMDIYKAAAPYIDLVAPDIYDPNFKNVCAEYTRFDNPLFIPECTTDEGKAFYAFAEHNAICFAPYAIDYRTSNLEFGLAYSVLNELAPKILEYQGTGNMHGFLRENDEKSTSFQMGEYIIQVIYGNTEKPSYGLIIKEAEDKFIVAGLNFRMYFSLIDENKKGSIAQAWEGRFEDNKWIPVRLLNGDDTSHNRVLGASGRSIILNADDVSEIRAPGIYRVTLYSYEY